MTDELDDIAPECPTCIQYQEIQDIKVERIKELQRKLSIAIKALEYYQETRNENNFIAIRSDFKSSDTATRALKEIQ